MNWPGPDHEPVMNLKFSQRRDHFISKGGMTTFEEPIIQLRMFPSQYNYHDDARDELKINYLLMPAIDRSVLASNLEFFTVPYKVIKASLPWNDNYLVPAYDQSWYMLTVTWVHDRISARSTDTFRQKRAFKE